MRINAVLEGRSRDGHGTFTWGKTADEAVEFRVILKEIEFSVILKAVAKMSILTQDLWGFQQEIPQYMIDKHYLRKFGGMHIFIKKRSEKNEKNNNR